ncbi:MAG TPA: hypothetical protein EYP68_02060 [Candidatus Korarchaeota archaeon]|nr:hypothetical protein [Candidatus Korarchaeota archaeon]
MKIIKNEEFERIIRLYKEYKRIRDSLGIKPVNPYDPADVVEKLSGKGTEELLEEIKKKQKTGGSFWS